MSTTGGPEAEALALSVGPNPTEGDATVRFTLAQSEAVAVSVYDVTGRLVATTSGTFAAGPVSTPVSTAGLAPGLYIVRVQGDTVQGTRTLTVTR